MDYYREPGNSTIVEQIGVIKEYPRLFTEQEGEDIMLPVTLQEIYSVLKRFAKDKSPGPDGWTSELFLEFFDIMGLDILAMVEETRLKGEVAGALNATFATLIPKISNPLTFQDFRPISLCNLAYKIISKVIACRIKLVLSRGLSRE